MKKIMVSGGFDPIHVGHVRMILEAAEHGEVVVVANSDDWLMRKKGYVFMPWEEKSERRLFSLSEVLLGLNM
jgi:D-beta-D-heptose 7-phosphate kinase/D-beta-D-heptose 1-phosphate adenosyltransferase